MFSGGRLSLHGAKKVSWTTLAVPALAGTNTLHLTQSVDWQVGDTIVVSTTSFYSAKYPFANLFNLELIYW